ncbi:hypothetical protein SAMN05216337_100445 [Bradyrhizobium brasilense]|uniref:Uncharacterized protein n=1 Tax=Bradyrhizobium brasilense TaxID=1419277 RepID=A0A1G6N813_9BRAD|nr:hypothetical protein [Bradyrhizobium brasilense]SDC63821.1 hypothetical protein SAMN05216337_100445 [Bradyrhizobium brasilense]
MHRKPEGLTRRLSDPEVLYVLVILTALGVMVVSTCGLVLHLPGLL